LQFARAAPQAPSGLSLHIGGMGFSSAFTPDGSLGEENPIARGAEEGRAHAKMKKVVKRAC